MSNMTLLHQAPEGPSAATHVAMLYKDKDELAGSVSRFIAEGLLRGEAVLVAATAEHWTLFVGRLALDPAIDLTDAIMRGQLRILDANTVLSAIMADGKPHCHRVRERAGSIIENSYKRFGAVRIYTEISNILCQHVSLAAAECMELCWKELAFRYPYTLLRAFCVDESDQTAYQATLECVRRTHSRLLPRFGYRGDGAGGMHGRESRTA